MSDLLRKIENLENFVLLNERYKDVRNKGVCYMLTKGLTKEYINLCYQYVLNIFKEYDNNIEPYEKISSIPNFIFFDFEINVANKIGLLGLFSNTPDISEDYYDKITFDELIYLIIWDRIFTLENKIRIKMQFKE